MLAGPVKAAANFGDRKKGTKESNIIRLCRGVESQYLDLVFEGRVRKTGTEKPSEEIFRAYRMFQIENIGTDKESAHKKS